MLVLETSPGSEQAIGLIRPRTFQDTDRAGVIGVGQTAQVLQQLQDDCDELAAALRRAGIRVGVTFAETDISPPAPSRAVDLAPRNVAP